jgi:hypothetical protein
LLLLLLCAALPAQQSWLSAYSADHPQLSSFGTDPAILQSIADDVRQAVLHTVQDQWREVRTIGFTPEQTLDALIFGLLGAAADLITHTAAPERREAIPRIAAERLIQAFKSAREREHHGNSHTLQDREARPPASLSGC